jgi:hypothetical protein
VGYADLAAFKRYLRIGTPPDFDDDTIDDVELQRALDTATSEIRHMCSRDFEINENGELWTRYFQPYWDKVSGRWVLPIDDLFSTTDLVVSSWTADDNDWTTPVGTITDADMRPLGAPFASNGGGPRPWTEILLPAGVSLPSTDWHGWSGWASDDNAGYLAVTAYFGWPNVPAAIVEATCIQASRTFKRRDAPFGVTSSPDGSENTRLTNTVDVEVQVAIRGYVKYWAAR